MKFFVAAVAVMTIGLNAAERVPSSADDRATVIVVAGAPGEAEFATVFENEVKTWSAA